MFEVRWAENDLLVVELIFGTTWTTDEFLVAVDKAVGMMKSVAPDPVYLIVDMTEVHMMPPDALTRGRVAFRKQQANMELCVLVGMHPLAKYMLELAAPLMMHLRVRLQPVRTVDDAYAVINGEADAKNASCS